jgi:trk system potassium uptake protein TrkA
MNIVIAGMGEVGRYISSVLVREEHNVVIIDRDLDALNHAEETLDALILHGHAGDARTLKRANIAAADLFVAVTDHCEVNIIAALRAKRLGAKRAIARVSEDAYFDNERGVVSDLMGIDLVINPNSLIALEMHKIVRSSNAVAVEDFAHNRIEMIQVPVVASCPAANRSLLDLRLPENTLVAAIIRDGDLLVPGGHDVILPDDEVLVVGRIEQIPKVERLFKRDRRRFTRRVIIVGGSQAGVALAAALVRDHIEVLLIERDRARARDISRELEHVAIINADGTDAHVLQEENVSATDAFVAASRDDEVNLMAGLLARDLGAPRVIALIHKPDYGPIAQRLGINAPLSPRIEVAKQVLKYVRAGQVVSTAPVLEGKGEFLEFVAPEGAAIVDRPIKQIGFPHGANICGVVDAQGAFVPRGDDVIEANDRVIVFTTPEHRASVEAFFVKR